MSEKEFIQDEHNKLFYHDLYGKDAILLREALKEIAEHLGHTWENPISISILCLELMIPYDIFQKIYIDIVKLINKADTQKLEINQIKEIMVKHFPKADGFSELTIRAFIKAIAKSYQIHALLQID